MGAHRALIVEGFAATRAGSQLVAEAVEIRGGWAIWVEPLGKIPIRVVSAGSIVCVVLDGPTGHGVQPYTERGFRSGPGVPIAVA